MCKPSIIGVIKNDPGLSPKYIAALGRKPFGGRHRQDSKLAAGLVGVHNPRAAAIGYDQVKGRAVRTD